MPHIELPQFIVLITVIAGFLAFVVGLLSVQIYMLKPGPAAARPIRREVTPASRQRSLNADRA